MIDIYTALTNGSFLYVSAEFIHWEIKSDHHAKYKRIKILFCTTYLLKSTTMGS